MCEVNVDMGTNITYFPLEIQNEMSTLHVWYRKSAINAFLIILSYLALRSPPGRWDQGASVEMSAAYSPPPARTPAWDPPAWTTGLRSWK